MGEPIKPTNSTDNSGALERNFRELPTQHPFENDPASLKAYEDLSDRLESKIKRERRAQFDTPPFNQAEVKKLLQPALNLPQPIKHRLLLEEKKILAKLGWSQKPTEMAEKVNRWGLAFLKELVEIDSQTKNIKGNQKIRQRVAAELEKMGGFVETYPESGVTLVKFRPKRPSGQKVLLLGHTDTVPARDEFNPNFSYKDGKVYGAGVADMKGGLVVMVAAIKALYQADQLQNRHITILLTSDEETGSQASRPFIEAQAKKHDVGLVFESGKLTPSKGGGITLGRKGILAFDIDIYGKTAHSGVAHNEGVDAGNIAAGIQRFISSLTDYKKGITSNVGIVETNSKTARNRFVHHVHLGAEVRHWRQEEVEELKNNVELIVKGAMLCNSYAKPEGKICSDYDLMIRDRPPSPVTEENKIFFLKAKGISLALDNPLDGVTSGGASDLNILVGAGLTRASDSWGLQGGGLHSPDEWGNWNSFLFRARLTALVILQAEKK